MVEFDIVIVGGGLVGSSLATCLHESNLKVAIIDKFDTSSLYSQNNDNRGIALSLSSVNILKEMKIWNLLTAHAYPIREIHVSEEGQFGFSKLRASVHNVKEYGFVVSAPELAKKVFLKSQTTSNLRSFRPTEIKGLYFRTEENRWVITLSDSTKIITKLLVAADGTNSFIRNRQNIDVEISDFEQDAVVSNIYSDKDHYDIAYERFTSEGPLALLPFGEKRYKLIWSIDNCQSAALHKLSDKDFIAHVQQKFGYKLGTFTKIDQRNIFPIKQIIANNLYNQAAVLIGNAANTLNPIAAQGYNLGLRDAYILSKVLKKYSNSFNAQDINLMLKEYANLRSKDHTSITRSTSLLANIYNNSNIINKLGRRIGLLATHFIPQLNAKIARQGMGLDFSYEKI